MNIFDYVDKYGKYTFEEKEFNDIDNLIFCSISYLNFTYTSINISDHTIEYLGREYTKLYNYDEIKKLGIPQKKGYELIEKIVKTKRYKDVIIHNYVYSTNIDKQFSAMMFKINDNLEYMCFEGTDELISGWKEDFELSYKFPVPSQKDAIKYANKYIKVHGPDIIIGGHSKGGNLALVAAMYTRQLKQFRIKKVYSNDGPGLKSKEFTSPQYRRIKRKYIHFVPDYSIVGILLRNDIMNIIKSTKKNFMSHALYTWVIDEDHLVSTSQSQKTIELQNNLLAWLTKHSDEEKEHIVSTIFKIFEKNNIKTYLDFMNFTNIKNIISNIINIDNQSKEIVFDLIKYNLLDKKE